MLSNAFGSIGSIALTAMTTMIDEKLALQHKGWRSEIQRNVSGRPAPVVWLQTASAYQGWGRFFLARSFIRNDN
jgi:hypothetical protein